MPGYAMKIKIIRDIAIRGEHYSTGSEPDVDDKTANELISIGKALPMLGKPKIQDVETRENLTPTKRKKFRK